MLVSSLSFALCLIGCSNDGKLDASPQLIEWGEIDFHEAMPEGGYDPRSIILSNDGEDDLTASFDSFDFDHLCLQGFTSSSPPIGLEIPSGEDYSLVVSVCNYLEDMGERDDLITGEIQALKDDSEELVTISWSFTPVFNLGGNDSGS